MIDYKKKLDVKKLDISQPKKKEKEWIMDVKYDEMSLCFKTPSLRLDKYADTMSFNVSKKREFSDFLADLEDTVILYLHSNSDQLFNGKLFSIDKLRSGMTYSWDITDDGTSYFDYKTSITEDTNILSPFDEKISFSQLSKNVSCIIYLESVIFHKDKFRLKFFISHVKSRKLLNDDKSFFEKDVIRDDSLDFFNE